MRFRTVGLKLSLALVALVAGALGDRLLRGRPDAGEPACRRPAGAAASGPRTRSSIDLLGSREAAFELDADPSSTEGQRVACGSRSTTYFSETPPIYLDARRRLPPSSADVGSDPIAQRAAEHRPDERRHRRARGDSQFAEVAVPFGGAASCSSPPRSTTRSRPSRSCVSVSLRAGLIALLAAALVGFLLARIFARRIHRLERAADRIAGGRFDEPVVDASADELGELARAFDRMREQLGDARARAARVHRQRLARAADADLRARRPRRAADRRGHGRADAGASFSPRCGFRSSGSRSSRPISSTSPASTRAVCTWKWPRSTSARSPLSLAAEFGGVGRGQRPRARRGRRARRRWRSPTRSGSARSAGSSSRTRFSTRRRERRSVSARRHDRRRRRAPCRGQRAGHPARRPAARVRALLPRRRRRQLGLGPRPRDRRRAGGRDGRRDRARFAPRAHGFHVESAEKPGAVEEPEHALAR